MRNIVIYILLSIFAFPGWSAGVVKNYVPDAEAVGEARLTYIVWDVYDAVLYAPNGQWNEQEPFALKLKYLRNLHGQKIADRSAQEMRKIGLNDEVKLAAWHEQMREIFPDVNDGTELLGIYRPNAPTRFYKNNQQIGEIKDPEFGRWFFNIWLSKNTTEPEFRKKLLGVG